MQGFISFVGFALWIATWVLIVKQRKGRGLFLSNLAGFVGGFILFAIFVAVFAPEPTADEIRARAEGRKESDQMEAAAKERKELEAAAAAESKDRSVMAGIICSNFVEASLKSPKSADFPWDKAAGGIKKFADQTYAIRSYVDAQNSYGAELRNWYNCKLQYRSGDDANPTSWNLISLEFSQ